MDRNKRRAVGSLAGRCDQRSCARSGATRNEMPDAARTVPATTAVLFTTRTMTSVRRLSSGAGKFDRLVADDVLLDLGRARADRRVPLEDEEAASRAPPRGVGPAPFGYPRRA